MTRTRLVPLFAALAVLLLFAGCKKQEAPVAVVAPLHAPASQTDDAGWKAYFQDVIGRNSQGVTDRSNAYYMPAPGGADYDGMYSRQSQGVKDVVARGVLPGNLLAFMSPDSTKMADLVIDAFKDSSAGSMKGVIVLFVGKTADGDRVKAAVATSGATYRFVEAK
ncbi:MAG: hypothetical protein ABI365_06325 [Lysobacteraceae bacterium]